MEQILQDIDHIREDLLRLESNSMESFTVHYCIEEVNTLIGRIREIIHGTLTNPEAQYQESLQFYRNLSQILPLMVLLQSFESPPLDHGTEENLPDTPSSSQSDEDSFRPATPPLHSKI